MKLHYVTLIFLLLLPSLGAAQSLPERCLARFGPLGPGPHPTSVTISPDGKTVAMADLAKVTWVREGKIRLMRKECIVRLYEVRSGKEIRPFEGHKRQVGPLSFSADGKWLAAASAVGSKGNALLVWGTASGKQVHRLKPEGLPTFIAFSSKGNLLFCASDQSVRIWDTAKWQLKRKISHPTVQRPGCFAISADGRYVAMGLPAPMGRSAPGTEDSAVIVWETATGGEVLRLRGFTSGLAMSPDGSLLAVKSNNGEQIDFWSVAQKNRRWRMPAGPPGGWTAMAFSPCGIHFAVASKHIEVWSLEKRKKLRQFVGHKKWVNRLAFSQGGKRLVSGGYDLTAFVWDLR